MKISPHISKKSRFRMFSVQKYFKLHKNYQYTITINSQEQKLYERKESTDNIFSDRSNKPLLQSYF